MPCEHLKRTWPVSFILVALLTGCSATRQIETSPNVPAAEQLSYASSPEVKRAIDLILSDSLFPPASIGVSVKNHSTGKAVYELNADNLFLPASNLKILTAAAAFHTLDSLCSFKTTIGVDSARRTIYIRGGGDPLLSTNDLDSFAGWVARNLTPAGPWSLVGDVSFFDSEYWGSGWMWDDEPDPTSVFISPLSVNLNTVSIRVSPGVRTDDSVRIVVRPSTSFIRIENRARTASPTNGQPLTITRLRANDQNNVVVSGLIPPTDTLVTRTISVRRPEVFTLTLLAERLRGMGFTISAIDTGIVPHHVAEKFAVERSIDSVVVRMLKESENLCAENLLKTLGAISTGKRGSARDGIQVVKRVLTAFEIDTANTLIADGSGLSRYSLISPGNTTRLLERIAESPTIFRRFYNALPVAGVDGLLATRMRGSPTSGVVRAKTGTMRGVSNLSGYTRSADGDLLAFSIMMQNFTASPAAYRAVQDSICTYLTKMRR